METPVFTITHRKFARSVGDSMCSLTEIQYLQIEPSEKGTYTNGSMILKICSLYGFVR